MKKLITAVFALLACLSFGSAHADSITGTVTADDNLSYWNGASWIAEGTHWEIPESINLTTNQPATVLYFAVSNDNLAPGGDPAGFLASFTDNTGTFTQTGTNTLVSNVTDTQVLVSNPWLATAPVQPATTSAINPTVDPTTLMGWGTPTDYGSNGTGIWNAVNQGPVSGISTNAQWLWTVNDTTLFYPTEDNYVFLSVNLATNPVATPEPSTLWLFALAGAMVVLLMKKKSRII